MDIGSRVFYDSSGAIITQLGEMTGHVMPREPISGLRYVDLAYGAIDHLNERLVSIDPETGAPITEKIERPQTDAERIKELEDELLLAAEKEMGGIL